MINLSTDWREVEPGIEARLGEVEDHLGFVYFRKGDLNARVQIDYRYDQSTWDEELEQRLKDWKYSMSKAGLE